MLLSRLSDSAGRVEAGQPLWLSVQPRDAYGNVCPLAAQQLVTMLTHTPQSAHPGARPAAQGGGGCGDGAGGTGGLALSPILVEDAVEPLGPLRVALSRQIAGDYELRLAVGSGTQGRESHTRPGGVAMACAAVPGATRFHVYPTATSPEHCRLLERSGEYGLCENAEPPRRFLTLRQTGYAFTVLACDRFGNTCIPARASHPRCSLSLARQLLLVSAGAFVPATRAWRRCGRARRRTRATRSCALKSSASGARRCGSRATPSRPRQSERRRCKRSKKRGIRQTTSARLG